MRRGPRAIIAMVLLATLLAAACGGDDFDEVTDATIDTDDISGAVEDLTSDLESQLDGVTVDELDDEARRAIDNNCVQLTQEADNTSLENALTDVCGDIRQALTEGSQDALDEAGERLDQLTE